MSDEVSEGTVIEFLRRFDDAQDAHDFDRVAPLIHPDAIFRFNDGDFRGLDEIRGAFETTWALETVNSSYQMRDIRVESIDARSATATFEWVWSGETDDGPFAIVGRGTTALVEHEGSLRVLIEHLSR